jgi:hypothetical protein
MFSSKGTNKIKETTLIKGENTGTKLDMPYGKKEKEKEDKQSGTGGDWEERDPEAYLQASQTRFFLHHRCF